MYAHHNTDNPEVLSCNRNNCRCGNDKNCMYYNDSDSAHYNYTAVQGTGDKQSPYYKCPSMAFDAFNQEEVYGDHAINGLGGYNDLHPYDKVTDPKGWYGPAPLSYPNKPTCGGHTNPGANTAPDNHEYDKWDKYHKYHAYHKVDNTGKPKLHVDGPQVTLAYDSMQMNLTFWFMIAAAGVGLWYLRNTGALTNRSTVIAASVLLLFFFLQNVTR